MIQTKIRFVAAVQDGNASFCLHKVSVPTQLHRYEWDFSDSQGDFAEGVVLRHGGSHCLATLERKDGSMLALLHPGGFHTLNKFRWGSKTYRYCFMGTAVICLGHHCSCVRSDFCFLLHLEVSCWQVVGLCCLVQNPAS